MKQMNLGAQRCISLVSMETLKRYEMPNFPLK